MRRSENRDLSVMLTVHLFCRTREAILLRNASSFSVVPRDHGNIGLSVPILPHIQNFLPRPRPLFPLFLSAQDVRERTV